MYLYNRLLYTQELTYNSNIINIHFISNKTMKHKLLGMLTLLLFAVHGAWTYEWDGSGTMSDPYLIKNEHIISKPPRCFATARRWGGFFLTSAVLTQNSHQ